MSQIMNPDFFYTRVMHAVANDRVIDLIPVPSLLQKTQRASGQFSDLNSAGDRKASIAILFRGTLLTRPFY